jgi:hypothetical protein
MKKPGGCACTCRCNCLLARSRARRAAAIRFSTADDAVHSVVFLGTRGFVSPAQTSPEQVRDHQDALASTRDAGAPRTRANVIDSTVAARANYEISTRLGQRKKVGHRSPSTLSELLRSRSLVANSRYSLSSTLSCGMPRRYAEARNRVFHK